MRKRAREKIAKKKALAILERVYQQMISMTDEGLFEHMMLSSPSYRKRVEELEQQYKEAEE